MRVTRGSRLFPLVLLLCLGSTNAAAQTELLWQHSDGHLAVWTLQGTNSLSGDPLGPGRLDDPLWQISAEADFNGDNQRDLIFQHQGDGRLAVWLMYGRAQISGQALSPAQVPDLNWKVRGAGDFNGDFKPDLIWQNEVTGQISTWLMDGTTRRDGLLLSPSVVEDTDWRIVGVADFNRDGHSDLLWQHQNSGLVSVWHMNRLRMVDGVVISPDEFPDTDVKLRAVGDVNGDLWRDLVWQNQATGLLSAWLMNDLHRLGEVQLSPGHVTDTNWRIVGIRPWAYSLTPSTTTVLAGGQLSVNWTAPGGGYLDWVGFFRVLDPSQAYQDGWWQYTNGATSGTMAIMAPFVPGQYEFRYLLDDGYVDTVRSSPVTVTPR
jgi:FG-GAP-like repeat